jgi:hypothetical protein
MVLSLSMENKDEEDCREVLDRVIRMIALKIYVQIENVVKCEVWCGVPAVGRCEEAR